MVKPLQLYFYYFVWIKHIYAISEKYKIVRRIVGKYFNDYFDSLILKSFPERKISYSEEYFNRFPEMSFTNRPVLVRREHLLEKNFWSHWAFAAVLLFNELRIVRYKRNDKIKFRLEVDLRNQSYGIYNNAGKYFLEKVFLNEEFKSRCIKLSEKIEDFLKPGTQQEGTFTIEASATPFRWSSGGILPIVLWKNRYWYVLRFRGVKPVGWNVFNGASETKEEYKNLYSLIYREFSEELILLNRKPDIKDSLPIINHKIFQLPHPLPEEISKSIINNEFAQRHQRLRKEQDGLNINFTNGPEIKWVSTPFEVQVTYHDANLRDTLSYSVSDVIFNINPTEFGIEVLLLAFFNMNDEDYLMDGEIWEIGPCLIREPVMLLSHDYIQKIFNEENKNKNALDTYIINEQPYLNCMDLNSIPSGEYHIFDNDIEFLKRRYEWLQQQHNKTKKNSTGRRRALQKVVRHL